MVVNSSVLLSTAEAQNWPAALVFLLHQLDGE